jgi:hypothetical protein
MNELPEVLSREITKAIKVLVAAQTYGIRFAVVYPEGSTFGDLQVAPAKTGRTRNIKYPHKYLQQFYKETVDSIQPGEVKVLNVPEGISVEDVRAAMSSACCTAWGNDSHTTHVDRKANKIELYRY